MSSQPDFGNQVWDMGIQGNKYCTQHPDDHLCFLYVPQNYDYHINLAANISFLAIFGLSLLLHLLTYIFTRRSMTFTFALSMGLLCEIIGYVGRILSWTNPWAQEGFLMQIICLTIGPAFMAAGLYLCLGRILMAFGPENSRIPPHHYIRIFVPCDIVALILQATGGAMASIASQDNESPELGTHIMVAGLAFQVATIVAFIAFAVDFAIRVCRKPKTEKAIEASDTDDLPSQTAERNLDFHAVRQRWTLKAFLVALASSTVLIMWRSIFRTAELSGGWHGSIIGNQPLFIAFEGALIALAVTLLNVFHPSLCAPELFGR